jgi:hypothetical protein
MRILLRGILILAVVGVVGFGARNGEGERGTLRVGAVASPAMAQARPARVDAIIAGIRRDVRRIDALGPRAHRHTIALEGFSTEGGEARVYFEGGQVARIAATHLGEAGRTSEEFYFRGGALIFAFRRASRYDRPFGNVRGTEEDRFYFHRNRMVRWRGHDQKLVPRANRAYRDEEARNLRLSAALLGAARSRARTLAAPE